MEVHTLHFLTVFLITPALIGPISGDPADNQLPNYWAQAPPPQVATGQSGIPTSTLTASQTVGQYGPILLQDSNFIDHLAHFDRERIPERVVHAKGGGAFGVFEVTHDITQWTKARPFATIGKKTPVLARFSTTQGESGAADTVRDGRGFAIKFYSEDGNWDLVGNNLPVFPIRDPILFPSMIRSRKRNPATHLHDTNAFWDFNSLRPETTHHTLLVFSDLGIPNGFRFQNGFGVHTFKLVNAAGEAVYVKFHFKSNQGIQNLDAVTAQRLSGDDPDYALRDLYNAIASRDFPSWDVGVQIMTFKEAETYRWNPFDITKIWLFQDFPLLPVGKLTLNRNPTDYFTQIEQAAFSPSNMIAGVEPSPDRMLHGRMFSYPDTQRYRLGPNFLQLPVNRPFPGVPVWTYQKDGLMCSDDNGGGAPNYFPNSFNGPIGDGRRHNETIFQVASRDVVRVDIGDEDNYSQVDWYWKNEMDMKVKQRFISNLADSLKDTTREIQARVMSKMFDPVNSEISSMLRSQMRKIFKSKT